MLFIYQPKDWLKIAKDLRIPVVKIINDLNISRRNFYNVVEKNNSRMSLVIDFNNYIDADLDYEKIPIIPPKDMLEYFNKSFWTYRSIAKESNISYVTCFKCTKNNDVVSYKIYKNFSDVVQIQPYIPKPKKEKPKQKMKPKVVELETPAYKEQPKKWDFYEAQKEFLNRTTLKQ